MASSSAAVRSTSAVTGPPTSGRLSPESGPATECGPRARLRRQPELQGLGDVVGGDLLDAGQVRDGACHFAHAFVAACGQAETLHRRAQETDAGAIETTVL